MESEQTRTHGKRTPITQTQQQQQRERDGEFAGSLRCVFIFMNDVSGHRFVPYNTATKRQ